MYEGETRWRGSVDGDREQQQISASPHQLLIGDGEDQDTKTPKKRAETWIQDEIKVLIAYRKEMESLFNTSKSNKHLWEQISRKMKEHGYDRSATMCTDKWRNLLKEYKKAKAHDKGTSKVAFYKDLEEILGERAKSIPYRSPAKPGMLHLSTKGKYRQSEDERNSYIMGLVMAGSPRLNLEHQLDHDGHPTTLSSGDGIGPTFAPNGVPPSWSWRETNATGQDHQSKIIVVKFGDITRKIRVDGPFESIKETIKNAFGLRTKRPFWLEDDEGVVQPLSQEMASTQYSLNLDPGMYPSLKVCLYDESGIPTGSTESRTLYSDEDFSNFLMRRGWQGFREMGTFRDIYSIEDMHPGAVYQRAP
ncbi:unnamed protein product [Sphagnum troendelagicum]